MDTVFVQPGIKGRVAIWDRNPVYEDGELWIAWGATRDEPPAPVEVPLTTAVSLAVSQGRLVVVAPKEPKRAARKKATLKSAPEAGLKLELPED